MIPPGFKPGTSSTRVGYSASALHTYTAAESNPFSTGVGDHLGQNQYLRFPATGGPVGQNTKCKNIAQLLGETFGVGGFSPQTCPSLREIAFFCFWPGISLCQGAALGQKGLKTPVLCDFPPVGVRSVKTQSIKTLRTTIPGSVVTVFCDFGTPSAGKMRFSVFSPRP